MREKGRTEVHRNPWYAVVRTDFVLDDGEQREYFTVQKPDSVLVIPRRGSSYLLIELIRPTVPGVRALEFPQGAVDGGETWPAAAARELREETGWRAGELSALGTFTEASGFSSSRTHVYVTDVAALGEPERDAFERDIKIVELTHSELRTAVTSGRIVDGATLAAVSLVWAAGDART